MRPIIIVLVLLFVCNYATAFECTDSNGDRILQRGVPGLNDIAIATIENGEPIVLFNSSPMLTVYKSQTITFITAHECAHHRLNHTIEAPSRNNEQEADCWAIKKLFETGEFSREDIRAVQSDLTSFGTEDWSHIRGGKRATNLNACLRGAVDPRSKMSCSEKCSDTEDKCSSKCSFLDPDVSGCASRCLSAKNKCNQRCAKP